VTVTTGKSRGIAIVEWEASPVGDVLADAVIALLMHAQSSAAAIRLTSKPCNHRRLAVKDDADETEDTSTPANKRQKELTVRESRLRLIHHTLKEQYASVEAVYEGDQSATFEIKTDAGLESGSLVEGETLLCNVSVSFVEGNNDHDAKISVECADGKIAANIQDCLRSIITAAAPLKL
jgi:hypothetical protein